jgi:hypothetical protein
MTNEEERTVVRGSCFLYIALDLGFAVDLKKSIELIAEAKERSGFRHNRKAPVYFDYDPRPVAVTQSTLPIEIGKFSTTETVALSIFDFGAVSLVYEIPIEATMTDLVALSSDLYDNAELTNDAQERVESLLRAVEPAVSRPSISRSLECYTVMEIHGCAGGADLSLFVERYRQEIAQILSSDTDELSEDQVREEISARISHYGDDMTIITWNAAMLFGPEMDDVRSVLEFVNVQLLELVHLDYKLDRDLDEVYQAGIRPAKLSSRVRKVAELMIDGQFLNEAISNALKLLGDPFLARVYAIASRRFGLDRWGQNIKDKLSVLHTIYSTKAEEAAQVRSERLEIIIILLILIELVITFVRAAIG